MAQIDIIHYLEGLTAFVFDKAVLTRIAVDRAVIDITDTKQLTQQQKDLLLADLLYVIFTAPNYTASLTNQHGAYTQTIGSQRYDSKKDVYNIMIGLYKKWDDPKAELLGGSTTTWINEYD